MLSILTEQLHDSNHAMPATAVCAEKLRDKKQFDVQIQRDHIIAL